MFSTCDDACDDACDDGNPTDDEYLESRPVFKSLDKLGSNPLCGVYSCKLQKKCRTKDETDKRENDAIRPKRAID